MNDFAGLPRAQSVDWQAGGQYGMVNYGSPQNMVVIFHKQPVKNEARSLNEGRPIFEDRDYVRMHPPGERLNIIDRPVMDNDKLMWPMQWNLYLQNAVQVPEGTPIDLLFPNQPSIAESLKALGVHTVEQCANLSGNAIDTIGMGAQDWKTKAKSYLENASKGSEFIKITKVVEDRDGEIRTLKRQLDIAIAQIKALEQKINMPAQSSLAPAWQPNYDPQAERIAANHQTRQVAEAQQTRTNKRKRTPKPEDGVPTFNVDNI